LSGALVFTNYKTNIPGINKPFSYVMNFHDIIEFLNAHRDEIIEKKIQVMIGLTEMWSIIKYYNDPGKQDFYSTFSNQLRKFNADVSGDTQRYKDIPPGLRDNVNQIFLPSKTHDDGVICREPRCKLHHTIEVREVVFRPRGSPEFNLIDAFDAAVFGQFYNSYSNEIVREPGATE
jgi:hypothetical protein